MSSQSFETTLQQHLQQVSVMTPETYSNNLFTLSLTSVYDISQNGENSFEQRTIATSVFYDMLSTTAGTIYLKSNKSLTVAIDAKSRAFMMETLDEPCDIGNNDDVVHKLVSSIHDFTNKIEPVFKHHKITYTLYMYKNKYLKTFKGKSKDSPIDISILLESLKEEIRRETKQCLYDTRLVCKNIAGLISSYVC